MNWAFFQANTSDNFACIDVSMHEPVLDVLVQVAVDLIKSEYAIMGRFQYVVAILQASARIMRTLAVEKSVSIE